MESCKFRNHPVGLETYRMDHPGLKVTGQRTSLRSSLETLTRTPCKIFKASDFEGSTKRNPRSSIKTLISSRSQLQFQTTGRGRKPNSKGFASAADPPFQAWLLSSLSQSTCRFASEHFWLKVREHGVFACRSNLPLGPQMCAKAQKLPWLSAKSYL